MESKKIPISGVLVLLAHSGGLLVSNASLAHSGVLDVCKRLVATGTASDILYFLEGNSGNEALGLPGLGYLAVELVDLLQSESLGLIDTEVYERHADLEGRVSKVLWVVVEIS
jgi:hypothetical protein